MLFDSDVNAVSSPAGNHYLKVAVSPVTIPLLQQAPTFKDQGEADSS